MSTGPLLIIWHSRTGTSEQLAQAAHQAAGADNRLLRAEEGAVRGEQARGRRLEGDLLQQREVRLRRGAAKRVLREQKRRGVLHERLRLRLGAEFIPIRFAQVEAERSRRRDEAHARGGGRAPREPRVDARGGRGGGGSAQHHAAARTRTCTGEVSA